MDIFIILRPLVLLSVLADVFVSVAVPTQDTGVLGVFESHQTGELLCFLLVLHRDPSQNPNRASRFF